VISPRRALVRGFYAMVRVAHVLGFLDGKATGQEAPPEDP
jgi:hypothetical protein